MKISEFKEMRPVKLAKLDDPQKPADRRSVAAHSRMEYLSDGKSEKQGVGIYEDANQQSGVYA